MAASKYPRFGRLISKAIDAIAAHTERKKTPLEQEIADHLHTTHDRLRSWKNGIVRSMYLNEIEHIVTLALSQGRMPEEWLREFLNRVELIIDNNSASMATTWRQHLLDKYKSKVIAAAAKPPPGNSYDIVMGDGAVIKAISVTAQENLFETISTLKLQTQHPTIILSGGADYMSQNELRKLKQLFENILAPLCQHSRITVVDGATDTGVIQLMGQARDKIDGDFTLLGVVCEHKVNFPGEPAQRDKATLEANHSHSIFVPGTEWKHASIWMNWIAHSIAEDAPVIMIIANGGLSTWVDLWTTLCMGFPIIVVEGSGRTADDVVGGLEFSGAAHPLRNWIHPIKLDDGSKLRGKLAELLQLQI